MKSFVTFAGLAFASFAAAGPCRPRTTTTAAAVSSTEVASSTGTETAAVSTSTDYSVPVVSESSTLATVIVSETSATETSAGETGTTTAETSAAGTTTAETSAADTTTAEGTTTAEATTTEAETTTEAATATTTTAEPTADQSCDNAGLEYAIYKHTFYNSDPPHFSSFDPSFFHTATPTFQGETTRIGITPGTHSDTVFAIYDDSPEQLWQYKAVDHRAYLYAPESGDYVVTIPNSDEITLIWFGDKALEGWTRANADLEQDYPGGTSKTFTIHLQAGTYTPFRLLWANAQGDLNFIAEVQAPDGTVIVNGDGSDNKYFVRFACDESTTPFPAFGYGG
ncbi:hypothetical protein H9Q72_002861 [Fusarium xylarioides]|uniref:Uncharacterized protein n=1 Tax=Fusarium xylarioides TaxID=221167 RepID=A0A9P7L4Q5_9HYPO|nr:hypothetical protein H9Q70_004846 [Fusarium xylarioides]KAG5770196.1 hypothetical protein H9Q72_002861 [Fusarium xylarioides]KAG5774904.1 hypothetical protein H9Q73_011421 [Fusarium xylarioides]KAG5809376.1 hypothetical protein H9Q71_006265 [Fusarium xylarioides]KAG5827123.1 hypothetical protein H9Q74_002779 [Fusarium xylarioides]